MKRHQWRGDSEGQKKKILILVHLNPPPPPGILLQVSCAHLQDPLVFGEGLQTLFLCIPIAGERLQVVTHWGK